MTSNDSILDEKQIKKNWKNFVEKHGEKGFLILFFRSLFFRQAKTQLKSTLESNELEDDPGFIHYHFDGKVDIDEFLKEYEKQIKEECENVAREFVNDLENEEDINTDILKGEGQVFDTQEKKFRDSVHKILKKLHKRIDIEEGVN